MKISKGDTIVDIPSWLILVGLLVVDNTIVNLCNLKSYKKAISAISNKEES